MTFIRKKEITDCVGLAEGRTLQAHPCLRLPFGTIYSTHITADRETGIGGWIDDDFVRALHRGIAPDRHYLYPAFPYTSYTGLSRNDALAIKAYLFSLSPQHVANKLVRVGLRQPEPYELFPHKSTREDQWRNLFRSRICLWRTGANGIGKYGAQLGFQHGRQIWRLWSKSLWDGVTWPSSRRTPGGRSCSCGW
jgi:hypothetical protein